MRNAFILRLALFLGIMVSSANARGQKGAPISDVDILAQEKKVIIEHYPGLFRSEEITQIDKIDPKHSMIYYRRGGANFEAVVNSDRKDLLLVATCEEIPQSAVPKVVMEHFRGSAYGNNAVQKTFVVKTPTSSDFYRLDVIDKNKKIRSIFYDHLGMEMEAPY